MHASMMNLRWVLEVEHPRWDAPLILGPWEDRDKDTAVMMEAQMRGAIRTANQKIGPNDTARHFTIQMRQVDIPWVESPRREATIFPNDVLYELYLKKTVVKLPRRRSQ